jgi:DNA-binding transcriptional regulator YhcF (GntR family)
MPARATFTDAGVAFDADGALAPAAQLVAKLRLAIDAGAIPEGATLPSIRTGAAELGVHSNTLRKVYAALETQGYATTRQGSGTVATRPGRSQCGGSPTGPSQARAARERTRSSSPWRSWPGRARRLRAARRDPGRLRAAGRERRSRDAARRARLCARTRRCCRPTSCAAPTWDS